MLLPFDWLMTLVLGLNLYLIQLENNTDNKINRQIQSKINWLRLKDRNCFNLSGYSGYFLSNKNRVVVSVLKSWG